jgi:hypothetical protein
MQLSGTFVESQSELFKKFKPNREIDGIAVLIKIAVTAISKMMTNIAHARTNPPKTVSPTRTVGRAGTDVVETAVIGQLPLFGV